MIRIFSPFAYILPNGQLRPGLLNSVNSICAECHLRECAKVGYAVKGLGEARSCFKGLNYTYAADFSDEDLVWNGFLLKGSKYPPNYKVLIKNGAEIDPETIRRVIRVFAPEGEVHRLAVDHQKRGESRALHDLKHLVSALARVVESNEIRQASERIGVPSPAEADLLRNTLRTVYSIIGAIKNQIELSDFILAPDAIEHMEEREIDLYGLFEKNVHIYNVLASQKNKAINIRSVSGFIQARRSLKEFFVLLPTILLQNAIKYSVEGSPISVDFELRSGKLKITIRSIGPIIPSSERDRIWRMGEQYIHPNDTAKGGSGFGLYLAKSICSRSGFSISYEADFHYENNRGVPIGENRFIVLER